MPKEFWSRETWPRWLCALGVALAIVAIIFCFSHWFECHPGIAAWVQAIGIPFTIAAAIYVSWRENQNALDRDASQRRERSLAIGEFVAHDYFNFRVRVELLWQSVMRGEYNESKPMRPYSDMLDAMKLNIPTSFDDALGMAIDADREELKPCTNMIHAAIMHNNYLDDFGVAIGVTPEDWAAMLASIRTGLAGC